jgi:hypothetical protein
MIFDCQVLGGRVDGDTVKLEIEPAKGGDKEELEADVVLVSAGRASFGCCICWVCHGMHLAMCRHAVLYAGCTSGDYAAAATDGSA